MVINREMQTVSLITYTSGVDSYGQLRKNGSTSQNIQMTVKLYSQTNVQDPRYVDCEVIGLTKESNISTENTIQIGNVKYQILYVIPSGRFNQVLMKQCK